MRLIFCPLFSGSSGNSIYIGTDRTGILVDAGLSGARVEKALKDIGVTPSSLRAILVTHEHIDHIAGVGVLSRRYNLPVYATEGTWRAMRGKLGAVDKQNQIIFESGQDFYIDELSIRPFDTPHDAAQSCGYVISCGSCSVAIATDIGCVRQGWLQTVQSADIVLLESNYDPAMLAAGPYPYELKRRIGGNRGHLSNDDAAKAAVELARRGVRRIMLGHMSQENNFPQLAWQSVFTALTQAGYSVGEQADISLMLCNRDSHSALSVLTDEEDA